MARLGRRERQARLAFRGSKADLIRDNQAATKRPQTAGLEREFRLLSGVGKLGAGYFAPAMLKSHSLSKGCGASGAGRGSKGKPKRRQGQKLWSQPVRPSQLPGMVLDGQPIWADREEYAASIRHQQALALFRAEGLESELPNAIGAIRLIEALAVMVKPRRKRKAKAKP